MAQARLLAHFAEHGILSRAAAQAGVTRGIHYIWLRTDPDYAARFAEAEQVALDTVNAEIYRRAVTGWLEPVFYAGQEIAQVRKHSDRLLIHLAESRARALQAQAAGSENGTSGGGGSGGGGRVAEVLDEYARRANLAALPAAAPAAAAGPADRPGDSQRSDPEQPLAAQPAGGGGP